MKDDAITMLWKNFPTVAITWVIVDKLVKNNRSSRPIMQAFFASGSSFHLLQDRYNVGHATFIELYNSLIVCFQLEVAKEKAAMDLMLQK